MKKLLLYANIIVLMGCCCSCISNNDKCLRKLFEETGMESSQIKAATHLVIIPGNGCGRCIDKAKTEMHASQDTLYVVTCHSTKEFCLLTGRRPDDFPNVYLDTGEIAPAMRMVGTTPMVYVLEEGKFISRAPYEQGNVIRDVSMPQTEVTIDKREVNWGCFDHKESRETFFTLVNTGKDSLRIAHIDLSCDCLQAEYSQRSFSPGDSLSLKVAFQSDSIGGFIREIAVYGNFSHSPLVLTVEGNCI